MAPRCATTRRAAPPTTRGMSRRATAITGTAPSQPPRRAPRPCEVAARATDRATDVVGIPLGPTPYFRRLERRRNSSIPKLQRVYARQCTNSYLIKFIYCFRSTGTDRNAGSPTLCWLILPQIRPLHKSVHNSNTTTCGRNARRRKKRQVHSPLNYICYIGGI